jgi:hypothetical protein
LAIVPQQFQVTESTWPLLLMQFPRVVDADAMRGMMAAFDRARVRRSPYVSVLDATEVRRLPGAHERQAFSEWLRSEEYREEENRFSVASAVVLPSGAVRAFVAALYVIRKPSAPQHWVATLPEAVEWSCERLVEAGVDLTPEIESLRRDLARLRS